MKEILICWIGFTDLKASSNDGNVGLGPIAQAAIELNFDEIVLITDRSEEENQHYISWLKTKCSSDIICNLVELTGPTQFGEIYELATKIVSETKKRHGDDIQLTFHLSPGTPAMAAVWIIIAKTRVPATLIESSIKEGVKVASVPFDISAEFIPDLLRKPDQRLEQLIAGLVASE